MKITKIIRKAFSYVILSVVCISFWTSREAHSSMDMNTVLKTGALGALVVLPSLWNRSVNSKVDKIKEERFKELNKKRTEELGEKFKENGRKYNSFTPVLISNAFDFIGSFFGSKKEDPEIEKIDKMYTSKGYFFSLCMLGLIGLHKKGWIPTGKRKK